ncbi:general stress protein [Acetobacter pasteurianus]|uniref:Pyridoxine 4-dehydrogenase n=1 Tax=Acetobacter pasteurianus TaxID=438 RepID=A0A1A0DEC9_ACEPA|nr:aldo/keto reductase [Acetobacter pasteurianus]OAZ73211.1 Pyridoxine 4-dehydrogenase [Acetobacter pasteurianus]RCL08646.1 general stress protein [Acetobacter pasteurianus]GAB30404.1 Aldo/keto reductase [Acetobacter pasteurianus subsp. pasteurianus LMG 1262 = NBRC 106471]GCD48671.1 oxidoreductase [Acetobacter pasteurianus subsp. pasteurianus LMG 1262 = NBRC 106471]
MSADTIAIPGIAKPASRIALGTWAIGGSMWGGADDVNASKTIDEALELGINMIDTAPVYGFGHSEEVIGKALEGRRGRVILATKVGLNWQDGKVFRDSRPARIEEEVEKSLSRLRTDYIDLYQVHWPDTRTPFEETARALENLVKSGKVKALGLSNFSPAQMDEFRKFAPVSAVQPPYNLFEREIERDVLPYAEKNNLVVLAYGPLCRGLLSGRMTADRKFEGDDLRKTDPKFQQPRFGQYLQAVEDLKAIANKYGKSMLALAIRWVLDRGPTIALWGARKPEQIAGVDDAFGWKLDAEDMKAIDAILAKDIKDPVGPEFMAPPLRA